MAYLLPLSLIFTPAPQAVIETAIIDMMGRLAPILAPLLMIAALSAQFSAALAHTGGSGGLLAELTRDRIGARHGYVILGAVALILTWVGDVFSIIGYASRAFAFYYALQAAIAAARSPVWPTISGLAKFVTIRSKPSSIALTKWVVTSPADISG